VFSFGNELRSGLKGGNCTLLDMLDLQLMMENPVNR